MGFSWMELIAAASGSWLLKWRAWRISKSDKSGPMTDRTLFTLSSLSSNEDYRINKEIIGLAEMKSLAVFFHMFFTTVNLILAGARLQFRVPKAKEALLLWNVKPPIFTLCVGNAWGEAALLLAAGSRVNRSAIPSSTIMIKQPIGRFQGQVTDVELASKEIKNVKAELVNLLAKHIGKLPEEIEADTSRPKYFSPNEAVEYGIIDKVLYNERRVIGFAGGGRGCWPNLEGYFKETLAGGSEIELMKDSGSSSSFDSKCDPSTSFDSSSSLWLLLTFRVPCTC
ncbi:ATP-DEPENDENT CLP PROTEASE PROTEOLYTIC SUBUNIT [Salix viminalis]|uniref:ATP-dependent Clp protease proteolytic subunit n=1 Tax=Salix viminalis TaxID=40686 RepID=A0A9Q0TNI2_SALVM|nr:ATP-DEPENDENT CLP PROTEASE PROTEOLYTIC SUBUNIT [Salix viminalis]